MTRLSLLLLCIVVGPIKGIISWTYNWVNKKKNNKPTDIATTPTIAPAVDEAPRVERPLLLLLVIQDPMMILLIKWRPTYYLHVSTLDSRIHWWCIQVLKNEANGPQVRGNGKCIMVWRIVYPKRRWRYRWVIYATRPLYKPLLFILSLMQLRDWIRWA